MSTHSPRVRRRVLRNRWTVKAADATARRLIAISGIGTIIAVCGVFVVLAWVATPLFWPASITVGTRTAIKLADGPQNALRPLHPLQPLHLAVDEYQVIGWALL